VNNPSVIAEHSDGFRPGRGCREAVKRVEELLKEGRAWCVELDFKSYFDTIPQERLLGLVRQRVVDGSVLARLARLLPGKLPDGPQWSGRVAAAAPAALLRKREKRPGYGLSKADSQRWPNRWFAEQGLFSLAHGSFTYR
jgi:hypothetical protein